MVATHEGSVSIDSRRDLPGRGAWLHPDSVCVEKARHRRSFQRALRIRADIGEDAWDNLEKIAQQATAKTSTID
nr:YlxR family protein [Schaalia vaccimaxillae]